MAYPPASVSILKGCWAQDNLQLHQPWKDQFLIVLLVQYDLSTQVQSCQIHIWTILHTNFPFAKYPILSLRLTCSSQVPLKIRMSSKYRIKKSSRKGLNTSFVTRMKVVGALQSPNGITNHSNNPCFILKAVFHASCFATLI